MQPPIDLRAFDDRILLIEDDVGECEHVPFEILEPKGLIWARHADHREPEPAGELLLEAAVIRYEQTHPDAVGRMRYAMGWEGYEQYAPPPEPLHRPTLRQVVYRNHDWFIDDRGLTYRQRQERKTVRQAEAYEHRCEAMLTSGRRRCGNPCVTGKSFCNVHDPANAEKVKARLRENHAKWKKEWSERPPPPPPHPAGNIVALAEYQHSLALAHWPKNPLATVNHLLASMKLLRNHWARGWRPRRDETPPSASAHRPRSAEASPAPSYRSLPSEPQPPSDAW